MQIGVAGVGNIGRAFARWMSINTNHKVSLYDPRLGYKDNLKDTDVSFICVPVPTNKDGSQDYSMLEKAIEQCPKTVFIRSTVLPGTNDRYGTYSCPEFLTERSAYNDICTMPIVTGCKNIALMNDVFPTKEKIYMSNVEAEISKYAHNAFGALKVNFFNLIYNLCELRGAKYEAVLRGVLSSGYINETHTNVPGPDGKFGYGGHCFPKDLKALNSFYPTKTFEACLSENEIHRGTGNKASSL